jgi:hypothetical protein
LLAAAVESNGGVLEVMSEYMEKDFSQQVLAIDFDLLADRFYISLQNKDDVTYEDE